jgi:hypothetical protein
MKFLRTLLKAARKRLDSPTWRFLLVLSCVLVFSFAFHAKIAAYYHPGHLDTSTSSKLWLNGGEVQPRTPLSDGAALWFITWVALLVGSSSFYRYQEHRRQPVPWPLNQLDLRRYLRPPPRG